MEKIEYKRTKYPSDLTDKEWKIIEKYFPQGVNSEHHKRNLVEGVLYLLDNGCKWRSLPHDYPPWSTVHTFYFRARESGLWEKVLDALVKKND
jgi:transposase